jgi:hypothetical protein
MREPGLVPGLEFVVLPVPKIRSLLPKRQRERAIVIAVEQGASILERRSSLSEIDFHVVAGDDLFALIGR